MRNGRFEIEHGRDVQGRSADARLGVTANDLAVHRRTDFRQLLVILGLGQAGTRRGNRRALRLERRLGAVDRILGGVELLLGNEVRRRQLFEALVFALRGAQLDLGQRHRRLGLDDAGTRAVDGQLRVLVFLTRQDLALFDDIAFLDVDFGDDTGAACRDFDDAALDIDLAGGNGGIGAGRCLDGALRITLATRPALLAGGERRAGQDHGQYCQSGCGNKFAGHLGSLRVQFKAKAVRKPSYRIESCRLPCE